MFAMLRDNIVNRWMELNLHQDCWSWGTWSRVHKSGVEPQNRIEVFGRRCLSKSGCILLFVSKSWCSLSKRQKSILEKWPMGEDSEEKTGFLLWCSSSTNKRIIKLKCLQGRDGRWNKNYCCKSRFKEAHYIESCILQGFIHDKWDCWGPYNGELHREKENCILINWFVLRNMVGDNAECEDQVRNCKDEDEQKTNVVFRLLEVLEDDPEAAQAWQDWCIDVNIHEYLKFKMHWFWLRSNKSLKARWKICISSSSSV